MKSQEDYIKEIAEKINNGKRYYIENPAIEDIKNLKEFDYIITPTDYFDVKINRKYTLDTVLNIPVVMWEQTENGEDGYEIGDTCMGMIPTIYSAEEVFVEMKVFKGEVEYE